ncbi:extracellular solute-binding protein [Clostridiales bacterium COT073_COT-073]|nr:extracellular solute-binding protein [Clostridiales bacterium COT073_COT-073]
MPTINDIAKLAGVSKGTVSNVLNKKGNVSSEKVEIVERIAKELGYQIDEQAKMLRRGTSFLIAVVLPNITEPRYAHIYSGILRAAEPTRYSVKLYLTDGYVYKERQMIHQLTADRCAGVLAVSCMQNPEKYYASLESKVLLLLRGGQDESLPVYSFAYGLAGKNLAERLASGDDKRLIVICEKADEKIYHEFINGFQSQNHLCEIKCALYSREFQRYEFYRVMQDLQVGTVVLALDQESAVNFRHVNRVVGNVESKFSVWSFWAEGPVEDERFFEILFNYKRLGKEAGEDMIAALENDGRLFSHKWEGSSFKTLFVSQVKSNHKTIKLLASETPTTRALNLLLPNFKKQFGCDVQIDYLPIADIHDSLRENLKTDYDVIRLDVSSFQYFAPLVLEPLKNLDVKVEKILDNFLNNSIQNYSNVKSIPFALPFDVSVQLMFYRKDLFTDAQQMRLYYEKFKEKLEVPKNFDEYNRVAEFFSAKFRKNSPTMYGASLVLGNMASVSSEYLPRLMEYQNLRYDENGFLRLDWNSANKALHSMKQLKECMPEEPIHGWREAVQLFANGQVAMIIAYINHAAEIIKAKSSRVAGNVDYAPVPGGHPLLGGGCLGVGKYSVKKDLAYEFIKWATSKEIGIELMLMGGISANKECYLQREILDYYAWYEHLEENILRGKRRQIFVNHDFCFEQSLLERKIGKQIVDYCFKHQDNEKTITAIRELLDEIFQKN